MSDANDLIQQVRSNDVKERFTAWNTAGPAGAAAVVPLADTMASPDREIAKAAKESLHRIVHFAARPYGATMAREVSAALESVAAGAQRPRVVRVEAINWLSYVGDPASIPALVKLLEDPLVRGDARMALQRIPGAEATAAIQQAADKAPADFKAELEQALLTRKLTATTVGIKPASA